MTDFALDINKAVETFADEYGRMASKRDNEIAHARTEFSGGTRAEA